MGTAVLFAVIASSALVIGGAIGAWRPPSQELTAVLLAFAAGALITAVAFELFEDAFAHGGAWTRWSAFLAGAAVFAVVDSGSTAARRGRVVRGEQRRNRLRAAGGGDPGRGAREPGDGGGPGR